MHRPSIHPTHHQEGTHQDAAAVTAASYKQNKGAPSAYTTK